MTGYQVSVVVLTYNPDWGKLRRTLLRILEQKNVRFEIIVADDGSVTDNFNEIEELFHEKLFTEYTFVKHEHNIGIVKNFMSAIERSKGDYIAYSSPGDYFYSCDVLAKIYNFAVSKRVDVCYGNFVAYSYDEDVKIHPDMILPHHDSYFEDANIEKQKTAFFLAGDILPGCAMFRSRAYALKYIGITAKNCVYVEDNTSLMFSFADDVPIYHFDEYLLWYEVGYGISTQHSDIWDKRMAKDIHSAILDLTSKHVNNAYVDFFRISHMNINRLVRSCLLTFKHPILRAKKTFLKLRRKSVVKNSSVDKSNFPNNEGSSVNIGRV